MQRTCTFCTSVMETKLWITMSLYLLAYALPKA